MAVTKRDILVLFGGLSGGAILSTAAIFAFSPAKTKEDPEITTSVYIPKGSLPASSPPFKTGKEKTYEAVVTRVASENVLHVRTHAWVAQFAMASVCVKNKVQAPKPCHYEAVVTDDQGKDILSFKNGQKIRLHDLTPNSREVAAHQVARELPAVRPRQDVVAGPVPAQVVKLIDGDTVQVLVQTFPDHYLFTDIRIGEIDTPEKRSQCESDAARKREKDKAEQASEATRQLIEGKDVLLYGVKFEKYGGRVLGDVRTESGVSAAQNLIDKGLARPYDGRTKTSWCNLR